MFRGNPAGGAFVAFYLREGKLIGGVNVNVEGVNNHVQRLLRDGGSVDVHQLMDSSVPSSEWQTSRSPAEARPAAS